jgi:hypothetical protein
MRQHPKRRGMLLVRAGKEALGSCSARHASPELCGEQVTDLIHVQVARCLRDDRLREPHVPLGCGYESLEPALLVPRSFSQ